MPASEKLVFTVGHSNRTLERFIEILAAHGVKAIADVCRWPKSRHLPHFSDEALKVELPRLGMSYHGFCELGGRRRPRADSINTTWHVEAFRGFADYMQADAFTAALARLIEVVERCSTAIMCAESVPWRCHRSLIADALLARGWRVLDIFDDRIVRPHRLPDFACVRGTNVSYPAASLFSPTEAGP